MTCSIRKILIWTLVIVPIALTIIGIVLAFVLHVPVDDHGVAH
ncbi:hypothetical protein [Amycolatopsis balhimycina]|nr:hypothetical protein [Amycolatopsis balhimycina]